MVHLHVRSSYTLLKSTIRIDNLVERAKELEMSAIALTDLNVMHGAMAFYHACLKAQIKPIFGLECRIELDDDEFSFILLAKNDHGYQNCMKLSTLLGNNSQILKLNDLITYSKDCFVISSGDHSKFDQYIIDEDETKIRYYLNLFNESFDSYICGIVMNDTGLLRIKNPFLKQIAVKMNIKTVALSRVYMLNKDDEECFKVLNAIDQGRTLQDKMLDVSSGRYLRSKEEMKSLYDQDDLIMSDVIAEECNVTFNFEKSCLPHYENRYGVTSDQYLKSLCIKGLEKRLNSNIPSNYLQRLKYELDIIHKMNFDDYFLIVYDFIKYAKAQKIYVGPGRGSAPGSLVAYCLGITHLDPIKYHLLFERFLNPERISMPDIDTDFPDDKRDMVIQYVKDKYGKDRVAHIITFNTLAAKQVLRDVAKVLSISTYDIDILTKSIPTMLANKRVTLMSAYQDIPRFRTAIDAKATNRKLFEIALKLEGLPRHISTHAAGIVLSNQPIVNVCPLITNDDLSLTQFTMEHLEGLGLIKMDFLGIRNLTIIDEIVHKIQSDNESFDIMKIPLNDSKTFNLIQNADTSGVFQLESEGMKNLLRQMKPLNFEEIAATLALFRPGPMDNIPLYLENRKNPQNITYIHHDLKPILSETYGVILYQEQIMQIAQKMAGFTLGKADILRKAMSKKKINDLVSLKNDFIQGSIQLGYSESLANQVYDLILKFANYGFNKSHSIAYGLVAYQMAYLKANYSHYFFISLLNSMIGSETKSSEYIYEAKKLNIHVKVPSINYSTKEYVLLDGSLLYPLIGIKNVGVNAVNKILDERKHGKFTSYHECVARLNKIGINRKIIESCIMAGAFDDFKLSRASMLASLDDALRFSGIIMIEDENQMILDYSLATPPAILYMSDSPYRKSYQEREVLGFYLSSHPIQKIKQDRQFKGKDIIECLNPSNFVNLLGIINNIKPHKTKKGDLMCFTSLSDETGTIDLVIMPNLYLKISQELKRGRIVEVKGKVDKENSCLVNSIEFIQLDES
ncbi:MAG: DNA polymerase III subunit alpha [Traorella sp.]